MYKGLGRRMQRAREFGKNRPFGTTAWIAQQRDRYLAEAAAFRERQKKKAAALQRHIARSPKADWPRTVTRGPLVDGCLQVFILNSPKEAIEAGFGWIVGD